MRFPLPSPAAGKVERLTQVGYQVVGVLRTYAQPYR